MSSERQPVSKKIQKDLHPFEDSSGVYSSERGGPGKGTPSPLDFAQESPTPSNASSSFNNIISSSTSSDITTTVSIDQYHIAQYGKHIL